MLGRQDEQLKTCLGREVHKLIWVINLLKTELPIYECVCLHDLKAMQNFPFFNFNEKDYDNLQRMTPASKDRQTSLSVERKKQQV